MAEQSSNTRKTARAFNPDKGGWPNRPGPYIGTVMDTNDPTRSGRVKVQLENVTITGKEWITVSYMSPFLGWTPHAGTKDDTGEYVGNPNSYGMWFPVPDVGVKVLCFFVEGNMQNGYYIGTIPNPDLLHMIPAIGASTNYKTNSSESQKYKSKRLPVTELNNKNEEITEDSRFYDGQRPVHSIIAAEMFQQGVLDDPVRGPINSTAYRESPSNTFGISTPGRPIYDSGATDYNVKASLEQGSPENFDIIGRRGGHSVVMDDGDLEGNDNLIRIRTAKGHQITMSDDGNTIHIMHANGQSWVELGNEGTLDVYAANSINMRTQGTVNIHADKDINMYAKENINLHSKKRTNIEAETKLNLIGEKESTWHSKKKLIMLSDGTISTKSASVTSIAAGSTLIENGTTIQMNTTGPLAAPPPIFTTRTKLNDAEFDPNQGWLSKPAKLDSIVSRAPHHEPWLGHNKGTPTKVDY